MEQHWKPLTGGRKYMHLGNTENYLGSLIKCTPLFTGYLKGKMIGCNCFLLEFYNSLNLHPAAQEHFIMNLLPNLIELPMWRVEGRAVLGQNFH
jgi:hypothetical protein